MILWLPSLQIRQQILYASLLQLRVLQYFLAAAREENITKAAAFLHITQPTLSRQLMQMEEELGVKLFRRGKHNILLTEEGMLLRSRVLYQSAISLTITSQDFIYNIDVPGKGHLYGDHTEPERIAMLNRRRGKTLDEIHFKEKQIAHMDYLRYEMQKTPK